MSGGPRVQIVVDRLVVHATTATRARAVARDIEARLGELAHGWADGTVPAPAPRSRRPRPGPVTVAAPQPGTTLGSRVADAVLATVAAGGRVDPTSTTTATPAPGPVGPAPDQGATP